MLFEIKFNNTSNISTNLLTKKFENSSLHNIRGFVTHVSRFVGTLKNPKI